MIERANTSLSSDASGITGLTQEQKNTILIAIEKALGSVIETDLEKRAKELPNVDIAQLVNGYMQLNSVRKFILLNKAEFSNVTETAFNAILQTYFEAQICFAQSVTLERDVLTVSQYNRHQFGLDESILLLENIHDPAFDIEKFFSRNIQEQKLKHEQQVRQAADSIEEEKSEPATSVPLVSYNIPLFKNIQTIIDRIKNFYVYAEIKRVIYKTDELKQEKSYKDLQESVMWVNGQRFICIRGCCNRC
jgi:hypothetical protein